MTKSAHVQNEKKKRFSFRLSSLFFATALLVVLLAWFAERTRWGIEKNRLQEAWASADLNSFHEVLVSSNITLARGRVSAYVNIGPNCNLSSEQKQTRCQQLVNSIKSLASMEEIAVTKFLKDENGDDYALRSEHAMMLETAWDVIDALEKSSDKKLSEFHDLQSNEVADFIRRVKLYQRFNLADFITSNPSSISEYRGLGFFRKYLDDNLKAFQERNNKYEPGYRYESSWERRWGENKTMGSGAKNETDALKTESK